MSQYIYNTVKQKKKETIEFGHRLSLMVIADLTTQYMPYFFINIYLFSPLHPNPPPPPKKKKNLFIFHGKLKPVNDMEI